MVTPETIRIVAPSEVRHASWAPGRIRGASTRRTASTRCSPPGRRALALTNLFHAVGAWLNDGEHSSCTVHFGERAFTLIAPRRRAADATEFLLERTIQLQTALDTRLVIEQAKGILAERSGRHRGGVQPAPGAARRTAQDPRPGSGRRASRQVHRSCPGLRRRRRFRLALGSKMKPVVGRAGPEADPVL